jgi:hypothetical protein
MIQELAAVVGWNNAYIIYGMNPDLLSNLTIAVIDNG